MERPPLAAAPASVPTCGSPAPKNGPWDVPAVTGLTFLVRPTIISASEVTQLGKAGTGGPYHKVLTHRV